MEKQDIKLQQQSERLESAERSIEIIDCYLVDKLTEQIKEVTTSQLETFQVKQIALLHTIFNNLKEQLSGVESITAEIETLITELSNEVNNLTTERDRLAPLVGSHQSASGLSDDALTQITADVPKFEYQLNLLEARIASEPLCFGDITLKSLADTYSFVTDNVPGHTFCPFFDLVALMDTVTDPASAVTFLFSWRIWIWKSKEGNCRIIYLDHGKGGAKTAWVHGSTV